MLAGIGNREQLPYLVLKQKEREKKRGKRTLVYILVVNFVCWHWQQKTAALLSTEMKIKDKRKEYQFIF